jgi:hypothetical protein
MISGGGGNGEMSLSAEEGAKALYKLVYGEDPDALKRKRTGREAREKNEPLPYRYPLIGVKSVEEIKAELGIKDDGGEESREKCEGEERRDLCPLHPRVPRGAGSAAHETCAAERPAKREKDKWGKPIKECAVIVPSSEIPSPVPDIHPAKPDSRQLIPITCPCGIVFKLPRWRAKGQKYHSWECYAKYRLENPKKSVFSEEIDAQIEKTYRELTGMRGPVNARPIRELSEKLGMPRWKIYKRALALGCLVKSKKEPNWTEPEQKFLEANAGASLAVIQKRLVSAGFGHRSENGIKIRITRTIGRKPRDGYTARSLAEFMGIDAHSITNWVARGFIRAEKRGTKRTERNGGDQYMIEEKDVREFVIANVEMLDFRKINKFWLVDLLTGVGEWISDVSCRKSEKASEASSDIRHLTSVTGGAFAGSEK